MSFRSATRSGCLSLLESTSFRGIAAITVMAISAMLAAPAQAQGLYKYPTAIKVGATAADVTVPVSMMNPGTIAYIRVLTTGVAGLDYTDKGTGTCAVGGSASCTVTVSFKPSAPGERRGAVVLLDSNKVELGTTYLYAVGQGPLGVMLPGIINTVAGSGSWLYVKDGVAATSAPIFLPSGVAVDAAGNIFIADSSNNRIREVTIADGMISTVAGNGNPGFSGDHGLAINASVNNPSALALDGAGNLYIADTDNHAIRMVSAASGIITTVAGIGGQKGRFGDGGPATSAFLNTPEGLALDSNGNLYISDTSNNVVRVVNAGGTISTYAGNGGSGYSGDGPNALAVTLYTPWGLATAQNGDLYIADLSNNRVRKVSGGAISTVAGTGVSGFTGDTQPAAQAQLDNPAGVTVDVNGNLYIADTGNNRVRKVNAITTNITTIAGTGSQSLGGDAGPADAAGIYGPYSVALDGLGNLYIADVFHNRIREIYSSQSLQMYPAIRVGRVSAPQSQGFENDGNDFLNFSSIAGVTNGAVAVDSATTVCHVGTKLAPSTPCTVGAEFAPTVTGKTVLGSISLVSDAANTPGTINLSGEVDTLDPTATTLTASGTTVALGATVTFTSHVTTSGPTAPTGTVQFLDGTTPIGSTALNGAGTAIFPTTSLAIGVHSITAVYSGDTNNSASTSTAVSVTVKQTTSTTLTTSASSIVSGSSVTFTATVTAASMMPTGTIIFQDSGTAIGNGPVSASGVATFSTTSLAPGQHAITALYQGDGSSLTSTSAATTETVQAVTTVIVISSANPSAAGATVRFTVTATAASNTSTGKLSGSITFMDGTTTLGAATMNASGVATLDIATLTLGGHNITANYANSTYFTSATSPVLAQTVQQATSVTTLASSANPSIFNAAVTFTATVGSNGAAPTGTVIFQDGGTTLGQGTLNAAGKTTFVTSTLAVASHSIVAAYSGDASNVGSSSTAMSQVVQKATSTTTLASTPNPSSQNVFVQFTATVTSNGTAPTGTVLFMEGTATVGSATVGTGGIATWSTNTLGMGHNTIVAVYQGDAANNTSSSAPFTQNVLPATGVTLTSNHNPGIAGATVTFTAAVNGQGTVPTGTITFSDGATLLGTAPLNAQAVATLTVSTLSLGAHSITASYAGDTVNASSVSAALAETMQQAATQTVLTGSAGTITRGGSVTLTATVTGNGSTPGGSVAFMDNAQPLGTQLLNAAGVATLTTSALTVGQHTLTANYTGDTNDVGSNSSAFAEVVSQASPSIQINSSINPSLVGSGVTFTATLKNGVATPAGTVTWYDGAAVLGTSAMTASASSFNANTLSVGQHSITAVYGGDANNATATSGVLLQTVQQATTTTVQSNANQSIAGTTVHFSASVVGGSNSAVTGTVTFKDGASNLGTGIITNGVAVFDITTLTTGLHVITAVYSGDANSQASTSAPWTQSITAATTNVVLTSSANPSILGGSVTLTAVVTGNGEATTGAVTFKDGASTLGTGNITGGVATYTTSAFLAGQHVLTAQYAGDSNNQAAVSAALTQTVQQRTTTTLVSGANPALTAQSITLTATVSNGGGSAATGTVTFGDGAISLGTATLSGSGVATFAVTSLTAGQHTLTASYSGDTINLSSSSAAVTETVQLRATITSLAASGTNVTSGQPLTLFAAVQGAGPVEPTGTVSFFSGSTPLGSATLDATGVATLNYVPAAGTYNILAKYTGDTVYAISTSSTLGTITVGQALTFSLTTDPSSVTMQSKQHSVINVSLLSLSGFADVMKLGCLGLPSGASCTFSATTADLAAGGAQKVQVTLDTADPLSSGAQARVETKSSSMALACGLPAGVLLGLMLWVTRRNRKAIAGLVMLALTVLTIGLSGCGALQINGVAPGTYTVKVIATGSKTGITQSADVTLTVTQ